MILLCSASIDWAATGTWVTGLATAVIGLCALRTWKSQLQLQDRYQKADALLEAFVLCVRTGHNWQWNEISNIEKDKSSVLSKSEGFPEWREALMQYRLAWYKASHITVSDAWFSPDKLQSRIISIGIQAQKNSRINSELLSNFELDFTNTLKDGLLELSKLRNP
ncbi:hypothetical protein [Methylophilus sp. DW102]|uniref:hypothetical protein n=1 Tax=Methylophilus sp. DW102 TaxID=3095607 RepID=UPI00308D246E|nr:hypothetical protein MTDW_27500 [Methylophilus sp. DW102]